MSHRTQRCPTPRWMLPAPGALVLVLILASVGSPPVHAQEPVRIDGLGALSFPNSGAAGAQEDFIRGVLLLHSFEYDYAADAFRRAQEADSDFAMAYWGEAMTYNHPVWNEKDPEAAHAALARYAPTPEARQAKAPTPREKAYLGAVDVLYGDGEKAHLDTLYAREMEDVAATYPDDLEAKAFHALSLLGLSQGDRDVPTYMRAGAIALDVFERNPDHPGGAHYTIHAFDDPIHAPLAMKAARTYGPMAPDAAHAQHMTTHIFLAMGMWDDVVEANVRADAVTDRNLADAGLPQTDCGHYNEWLMYGYQQQGRLDDAEALLMGCYELAHDERLPEGRRRGAAGSYAYMRSLYLADAGGSSGPPTQATIETGLSPVYELLQAWGNGTVAVARGDLAEAERQHAVIVSGADRVSPSYLSPYVPVWRGTLDAMIRMASGDDEGALAAAHEAAEFEASLPVDFGPPIAFKPARELEADILLEMDRSTEALTAYQQALARTPNRMQALAGYARAAVEAGRLAIARDAYHALAELLEGADADLPQAREARQFLGADAGR